MKICPNCHTLYTDDTLRFCLQDGGALEPAPATQHPTAPLSVEEMETVARARAAEGSPSVETQWQPKAERAGDTPPKGSIAKVVLTAAGAALFLVLIVAGGAVGLWLYFRDPGPGTANANDDRTRPTPPVNKSTPSPTPTKTPLPTPTATVSNANTNSNSGITIPTAAEREQYTREVTQAVYAWKADTEAGNIDGQISRYASSVDYYRKSGATPEFIRADKLRAFRAFDSILITITDLEVAVGFFGTTATAAFDKEWDFDGDHRSTGKVRQELRFQKTNGRWLITSERDVKVYYTN